MRLVAWKPAATLKRLRERRGLTQAELAAAIGVHRVTVATWETGRFRPSVDMLPRLAKLLDVDVAELLKLK
jgi:transcriptional regulator with XRE-family HTH domain